jgi:hypothetical protein
MQPIQEDFIYPFWSAWEFLRDGYWTDPRALHIVAGFFLALWLIWRTLRNNDFHLAHKLVALYFALQPFNNLAYQLFPGASLGDLFGLLIVAYCLVRAFLNPAGIELSRGLHWYLAGAGLIFVLHAVIIGVIYPQLNADGAWVVRIAVLFKIFVLAAAVMLFNEQFTTEESVRWFVNRIVSFALVGIVIYLAEGIMLLNGNLPYGTFLGAGFVPVPCFGSVSIERGHFGKFITPLFPLFMLAYLWSRRKLSFLLFVFVTLINISASSLIFFAGYVVLSCLTSWRSLWKARVFFPAVAMIGVTVAIGVWQSDLLISVYDKVVSLAIRGEGQGGRGLQNFLAYLDKYPWGLSYGGSSLRNLSDLYEMNSGILAFITQVSWLAPFIIILFTALTFITITNSRVLEEHTRKILNVGILMMFVIFFGDILWFVPTIWASMLISARLRKIAVDPAPLPKLARSDAYKVFAV